MNGTDNLSSSRSEISVPLTDGRRLGEFIADLLGQRRSIERHFPGIRFEISFNWLLNLDDIISQRISAQNPANLVSFSAKLYFSNGKILTLEDHKAFRIFNDISNELSLGVVLKWTYLVKFPSKDLLDKEEIFFAAFTDYTAIVRKPREEKKFLSIEFTDITCGEDISAYMNNYIMSKTEKLSSWRQNVIGVGLAIWLPLALILGMVTTLWGLISDIKSQAAESLKQYGNIDQYIKSLVRIDDKVDFLIELTIAKSQIRFLPIAFIMRPITYIISLSLVLYLFLFRKVSYIATNEYSDRHYKKYDKRYDYVIWGLLVEVLVSVLAGLFSNSIYDYLKGVF